ncbi:hypothetical protein [Aliarcobacter cryaerophilus]|uniref:hypothetical protein n=1 Tax=Aliarcobacter cryaerophilus TaxID=28198 RepID=UPI003DA3B3D7
MAIFKYLITRQLAGYSGDFYINVNHEPMFHTLYDQIMDGSISEVNGSVPTADVPGFKARFNIIDKLINKSFNIHIKKNASDGLRFTLTPYIKHMSSTPSQILIIDLSFEATRCNIYIKSECYYKYILEKHQVQNKYRIIMAEVPTDAYSGIERLTENTDPYLAEFNIINTGDRSLKWQSTYFNSYEAIDYNKKYIGVPYTNKYGLVCDSFDRIEEIL